MFMASRRCGAGVALWWPCSANSESDTDLGRTKLDKHNHMPAGPVEPALLQSSHVLQGDQREQPGQPRQPVQRGQQGGGHLHQPVCYNASYTLIRHFQKNSKI